MIRKPAVSGLFYDNNSEDLKKTIEACFRHVLGSGKIPKLVKHRENSSGHDIYGILVPHAGYSYSGPIATHAYSSLVENGFPETFIILSPNHTGIGTGVSIFNEGSWNTPLGNVQVDNVIADNIIAESDIVCSDFSAHRKEHSCEVHLPFLQYFSNDFKIVPIVMWMQDIESSYDIANSIVKVVNELDTSVSIIASSDLTHYAPQKIANAQDNLVLDSISNMDEEKMMRIIEENNVTMCGYGPTIATIKATREFGANNCEILKYGTSGDISEDLSSVVGYASGIFV